MKVFGKTAGSSIIGDKPPACRDPRGNKNCAMANYEYHLSQSESDRLRLVVIICHRPIWSKALPTMLRAAGGFS